MNPAEAASRLAASGCAASAPPGMRPHESSHAILLLNAIQDGDLEMVQALIERGWSVESDEEQDKMAPMIAGCMFGRLDIARCLFARGARVTGGYSKQRWLVENGADVDDVGVGGDAVPVAIAATYGHFRIVKYLTSRGADTTRLTPKRDVSLQHLCAEKGNLSVLKYLVKNKIGRLYQKGDETRLENVIKAAVRDEHVAMVQYLLWHQETDAQAITACLRVAIENKQAEIVDLPIKSGKNGADVEATTERNENSLNSDIVAGRLELIKYLVEERNANIDYVGTVYNYSPVDWAKYLGVHDIEQYLLVYGAMSFERLDCDVYEPILSSSYSDVFTLDTMYM